MFESLTTGELIGLATLIGGIIVYAFKIERNTAKTSTSVDLMAKSMSDFQTRIDGIDDKVDGHGEKLVEHSVHINSLLNKDCS